MENKNLINMKKCPRFEDCSIPRCPLDKDNKKRVELREDEKCVLNKLLGKNKSKRMKGNISPRMRELLSFSHK